MASGEFEVLDVIKPIFVIVDAHRKIIMIQQPLVTIIVPVYNVEKYLRRCLDSIVSQTYTNFEVILVDDGSPDHCGEICDEYAAKDIRFRVLHQQNGGVSIARNAGLVECLNAGQSDYICFIDADDFIAPEMLHCMVRIAQSNDFDITTIGYNDVWENGKIKCGSDQWGRSENAKEIQIQVLRDILPSFPCGKLFKRYLWETIRFPEKMRMEDFFIMAHVFFLARKICVYGDLALYFYNHENVNSFSNSIGLTNYIRLRYDWFLGWKERESLAKHFAPAYQEECSVQAIHRSVRAGLMNWNENALSEGEYKNILQYLKAHRHIHVNLSLSLGRYLLLHGNKSLLHLIGWTQCWDKRRRIKF